MQVKELEDEVVILKDQLSKCDNGTGDSGGGSNPGGGDDGDWTPPGPGDYDGTVNGVCDDGITDPYNGGGHFIGLRGDLLPIYDIDASKPDIRRGCKQYPNNKVHGAHQGPTGPRWAPCWPHEPCYLR